MQKRISVRNLVEFIMRSGSIDSRFTGRNRLEEGSRIHRKLQKAEGYKAEVHLCINETHDGVDFTVEGRADGVITTESGVTIDEIKSTVTPLEQINEDYSIIHWSQAMCYGYMYCACNDLTRIDVRLTYCDADTGSIKRFNRGFTVAQLRAFFAELLMKYAAWARFECEWKETAQTSMKALKFPFESYREGQRRFAAAVYKMVLAEARLFAMAPTGTGKTISALFPAIKAMGEGKAEKIFYLTAKTVTRQAAQDALDKMREGGLRAKSVIVTAKDKICFLDERVCKPSFCEYANGHYDRVNAALMDILQNNDGITSATVTEYAKRHRVCPFELELDVTLWCDVIICDYNYLFDPLVYLKRFFADGGDYVFLVDEAHNLPDRAREMFSASVSKRDLLAVKKAFRGVGKNKMNSDSADEDVCTDEPIAVNRNRSGASASITRTLNAINKILLEKRREVEESGFRAEKEPPDTLIEHLGVFVFEFARWLSENPDPDQALLEAYFQVLTFLKIAECFDDRYETLYETAPGGEMRVKLFCADPSYLLDERFCCGKAAILFSATLTPAGYYTDILGGGDCRYLALPSPFPHENMLLLIGDQISTKYKDRDGSIENVADMILKTSSGKPGNYIAYFPSYSYLSRVYTVFREKYPDVAAAQQEPGMTEDERESFLALFESEFGGTFIAFCVLGGVFSEGIDLAGDKLIGTVIVGVGLPQINKELDVVKRHFGGQRRGFDFAYRFPGMNKVLQAAGRVIRSEDDRGVVLLIDERFASHRYTSLFPAHWHDWQPVHNCADLSEKLERFWENHN